MGLTEEQIKIIEEECKDKNSTECNNLGAKEEDLDKRHIYYNIAYDLNNNNACVCYNLYSLYLDSSFSQRNEKLANEFYSKAYNLRLFRCFYETLKKFYKQQNFEKCFKMFEKDYFAFNSLGVFFSGETKGDYICKINDIIMGIFKSISYENKIEWFNLLKDSYYDIRSRELLNRFFLDEINSNNYIDIYGLIIKYGNEKIFANALNTYALNKDELTQLLSLLNEKRSCSYLYDNDVLDYFAKQLVYDGVMGWDINYGLSLVDESNHLYYVAEAQRNIDDIVLTEHREYTASEASAVVDILRNRIPGIIGFFEKKLKYQTISDEMREKLFNINVVLSNEIRKINYPGKSISINDIIELLKKLIEIIYEKAKEEDWFLRGLLDLLEKLLNDLLEASDNSFIINEAIDSFLNSQLLNNEDVDIESKLRDEEIIDLLDKLLDMLKSRPHESTILGLFEHDDDLKIILYLESIKTSSNNKGELPTANVIRTLAHELFHAIHYLLVGKEKWEDSKKADICIESLASFFEYRYIAEINGMYDNMLYFESLKDSRSRDIINADKLLRSWKQHKPEFWPYAGAKFLNLRPDLHYLGHSIVKEDAFFRYVFNKSLDSLTDASNEILKLEEISML